MSTHGSWVSWPKRNADHIRDRWERGAISPTRRTWGWPGRPRPVPGRPNASSLSTVSGTLSVVPSTPRSGPGVRNGPRYPPSCPRCGHREPPVPGGGQSEMGRHGADGAVPKQGHGDDQPHDETSGREGAPVTGLRGMGPAGPTQQRTGATAPTPITWARRAKPDEPYVIGIGPKRAGAVSPRAPWRSSVLRCR